MDFVLLKADLARDLVSYLSRPSNEEKVLIDGILQSQKATPQKPIEEENIKEPEILNPEKKIIKGK